MTRKMKRIGFALRQAKVHELTDYVTPLDRMFCVYHMGVADVDAGSWTLAIGGLVERETRLTLGELASLPQVEVTAFHECAGSPLKPTLPVRRVGNVVWRGVRLRDVVARAGIGPEARYLWSYGADHGSFAGVESPCYLKDLPLEKALADEVLLATHINGEPLPDEHGGPVRLVVPGFYGTNSTKWLTRLELRELRSPGYFTTALYNDRIIEDGVERSVPVWAIAPHSVIVAPAAGARLERTAHVIAGWAWGADEIARVELSTDGAASWRDALVEKWQDLGWQRFSLEWTPSGGGRFSLACRATDRQGRTQPDQGARNAVFRIEVSVGET